MNLFKLFISDIPAPRHRRQVATDPATSPKKRRDNAADIVYMAGRAFVRAEEVDSDNGSRTFVLDASPAATNARSGQMDYYDVQACNNAGLREELYASLKPVWADGLGYRAAETDQRVRNLSHAGERTRAKYWAAMNAAQQARQ